MSTNRSDKHSLIWINFNLMLSNICLTPSPNSPPLQKKTEKKEKNILNIVIIISIYSQRCTKRGIEHDAPVARYYERLATVQARGSQASHQVLRDILKDVQSNMVPRGLLKEWAVHTFQTTTDYWTFRKTVGVILSGETMTYGVHI